MGSSEDLGWVGVTTRRDFSWGLEDGHMPSEAAVVTACWREWHFGLIFLYSLLFPFSLCSLSLPSSTPFLPGQCYLIFEIPMESRDESQPPDASGQGLKHSHKSEAHFSAMVKLCERLVSVAPALSLYGLLWLLSIKRPNGVIWTFLSVC